MKKFKLIINRFDDEVDLGKLLWTLEVKSKGIKEAEADTDKFLTNTTNKVSGVISVFDKLDKSGSTSISKLKSSIKSLMSVSSDLNKKIGNVGKEKTVTSSFAQKKSDLRDKFILDKSKMGFTGGESDDIKQLFKERDLLVSHIGDQKKLIKNEYSDRVKGINEEISAIQKKITIEERAAQKAEIVAQRENAKKQAEIEKTIKEVEKYAAKKEKAEAIQAAQQQQMQDFTISYTTVGEEETSAKFRAEMEAVLNDLSAQQKLLTVKKLMREEDIKASNEAIKKIKDLKEEAKESENSSAAITKLRSAMNALDAVNKKVKNSITKFVGSLKQVAINWRIIGGFLRGIVNTFADLYEKAASYEEALNLYRTSLGEYADEADEWAERISTALYLDPKQVMQYTGAFYNLVKGLGVGADAAFTMARNLTQLSYDMSSYLNIDVEVAHDKIQSAITGQSKAVASAGIAMQQASLQELAYSLKLKDTTIALDDVALEELRRAEGIKKSVSEMTQAEKTYLRYIQIMKSTKDTMQMDLGKTIVTPENAVRVVKTQFELLGRAIGNIFIPIVMKAIPYIIVMTEALKRLAKWLATLTGYEIADVDYDKLKEASDYFTDVGDAADNTAGRVSNAADKINRSLAPFDELNVVESESAGNGLGSGIGVDNSILDVLDQYVYDYDMLGKLSDEFNNNVDKARENLRKMLPYIELAGALLLTWKLTKDFMKAIMFFDSFLKALSHMKSLPILKGIKDALSGGAAGGGILAGLTKIPAVGETVAAVPLIGDAISGMVGGTISISEGLAFIGEALLPIAELAGGILGIILGVVETIKGIKNLLKGDTLKGVAQSIEGVAWAVAGVSLLFGQVEIAAIAAVVAIVAAVVAYWDEIKAFVTNIWQNVSSKMTAIANKIMDTLLPIVNWIKTKIIDPILKVVSPLFENVANMFKSLWSTVELIFSSIKSVYMSVFGAIWEGAVVHITNIIDIIKTGYTAVAAVINAVWDIVKKIGEIIWTLISTGIEAIIGLIKKLGEKFKEVFGPLASWINTNVIQPFVKGFTGTVTAINEKMIQPLIKKFTGLWTSIINLFKGVGTSIASAIYSGFKSIMNGAFKIIEDKINSFINILNTKLIDKLNDVLPANKQVNRLSTVSLPRFAEGGYPTSGDLFLANENGNAEYITSLGNRTAVANQDQMVTALTNAILQGMSAIETSKQPNHIVVQIGNDKIYEGQGTYQNRQADRYGTTYVTI